MINSNQYKISKELMGIYVIRNLINKKVYIGSTVMSFRIRRNNHNTGLDRNCHKNQHLQAAYNKYGGNNFEFDILEVVTDKDTVLEREQFWLDNYPTELYNINKKATSINSIGFSEIKEVIDRRNISISKALRIRRDWYLKVKSKEITFEEVPKEFKRAVKNYLDYIPCNKGKFASDELKLKLRNAKLGKKQNPEAIAKRTKILIELRSKKVYVYKDEEYLGVYDYAFEIEKMSLNKGHILQEHVKSKFSGEFRRGTPYYVLQRINILYSANHSRKYKGLTFSYVPLHQEIDVEKQDNIGESLTANTEITSSITKGEEVS